MPIYKYRCDHCSLEWEAFRSVEKRSESICTCGRLAKIIISPTAKPVIYEGYNEGLGTYVTGPAQKRRIMRDKNLEEK